jgi:transcriptional regulator CtsR
VATSDLIAKFILELLEEANGTAELQRSTLADMFNCVPSQINYVIATRFSPEHGYIVESRRGGGGYIRITRVRARPRQLIMHTVNAVGDSLDMRTANAFISNAVSEGALDKKSARLILSAIGDNALRPISPEHRDVVRASIFKQMLINTISD